MPDDLMFTQVESRQLEEKLKVITPYDLIAVTLVNGDVLLGGIFKHWEWNGQRIELSFNTPEGKRFGSSYVIDIPLDSIADIVVIPMDDESMPKLAPGDPQIQALEQIGLPDLIDLRILPQDYPNPLASVIYSHNSKIASDNDLFVGEYAEFALPQDAIPPEGLYFDEDFLIYADWDFFHHQASGGVSLTGGILGVLEISKDVTKSPQQQVLQRLRERAIEEEVRRNLSPTTGECILHGCILVEDPPDTTEIEGEECHLWTVVDADGESHPVLVKVRMLKYPLEFIGRVNSVLTFYGELLPAPLNVLGTTRTKTLLAHAIAYFHTN